mmetsp:Transcript_16329/g.29085  ORF Transcript_16329/g.29085 Transcript_16329/m.29085 type:complete len:317 (-) Transcript_16329:640-1590(-)
MRRYVQSVLWLQRCEIIVAVTSILWGTLLRRRRMFTDTIELHVPENVDVVLLQKRRSALFSVRGANKIQRYRFHSTLDDTEDVLVVVDWCKWAKKHSDHHKGVGRYDTHVAVKPENTSAVVRVDKMVDSLPVTVVLQLHSLRMDLPTSNLSKVYRPCRQTYLHRPAEGGASDNQRCPTRCCDLKALTCELLHCVRLKTKIQREATGWLDSPTLWAYSKRCWRYWSNLAHLSDRPHLERGANGRHIHDPQLLGRAVAREDSSKLNHRLVRQWYTEMCNFANAGDLHWIPLGTSHVFAHNISGPNNSIVLNRASIRYL